jgi:hypothetical protein
MAPPIGRERRQASGRRVRPRAKLGTEVRALHDALCRADLEKRTLPFFIAKVRNTCYGVPVDGTDMAKDPAPAIGLLQSARKREDFFIPNARNPLKSPDSKK